MYNDKKKKTDKGFGSIVAAMKHQMNKPFLFAPKQLNGKLTPGKKDANPNC